MTDEKKESPIRIMRLGNWSAEAKYNTGIPQQVIDDALAWVRDGDHALLTTEVADFVLRQHRAMLMELDAKGRALYEARQRITAEARTLNERLALGARSTEAYDIGYRMGRYLEIDRCAETIQQIADAGAPQPDAPTEPAAEPEPKP